MSRLCLVVPLLLLFSWTALVMREPAQKAMVLAEDTLPLAGAPVVEAQDAPDSLEALRERIAAVLRREQVAGVGLALVDRRGVVWAGGVGVTDRETGRR